MFAAVIADEWGVVRQGVRALLADHGIQTITAVGTAMEGLTALSPGNLLVVGSCPDASTESTVQRAQGFDDVHVIALTSRLDRNAVLRLCAVGADAVLDRSARDLEIGPAVANIRMGRRFLSSDVLEIVFSASAHDDLPRRATHLTARERSVLELLAGGRSNRDIAESLHIGTETVKTHLSNLYVKLGVRRRDQAIAAAFRSGLL